MQIAADDQMMEQAMNDYQGDWKSAGDATDDYWRTWVELHCAHHDGLRRDAIPVLPLIPGRLHVAGALLKTG